jgi:serine/threonine-protein kinase HipA
MANIGVFDEQKALIDERFDRHLSRDRTWWTRLPQEDMCQALGMPSTLKYEADGGPGMADIFRLLEGSQQRDEDRRQFFRALILFWMLAAPDGHAKNFSLHIAAGGSYRMTPLYDVLSAWPVVGRGTNHFAYRKLKMAMAVRAGNAHYHFYGLQRRHWKSVADRFGLAREADRLLDDMVERTPAIIDSVVTELPSTFPAAIAGPIFEGLIRSAKTL